MNLSGFLSGLWETVKGAGYWIGDLFNNRSHDGSIAQMKAGSDMIHQSGVVNALESLINKETGAELTGAQRQANQFAHDERIDAQNWNAQREDTLMQRTVNDYQLAGINPMALAGGNVAAQPASSSGASSVSPSSEGGLSSLLQALQMKELLPLQKEALVADIQQTQAQKANIVADTAKKEADTKAKQLETQFNLDTYDLRRSLVDDQHAWNILRKELETRGIVNQEEQTRIIRENGVAYREFLQKQGELINEQKLSEPVKRAMLRAQERESSSSAAYLAAMKDLQEKYISAKTDSEKQHYELLKLEAQLKHGVYTEDYFEALRTEKIAEADLKDTIAAYERGDYSKASKSLQKVFKEFEKSGKMLFLFNDNISSISPLQ